eukprot:2781383-Alexandrium_andersonii.AAC.1
MQCTHVSGKCKCSCCCSCCCCCCAHGGSDFPMVKAVPVTVATTKCVRDGGCDLAVSKGVFLSQKTKS